MKMPNMARPQNPEKRQISAQLKSAQARSKADDLLRKFSWEKK